MSSSKIALLILHGCALYLFVSWVLWKAQGTWKGRDRTSLKAHDGDRREKCQPVILTPVTLLTMISDCHGQQLWQAGAIQEAGASGTLRQKLMWTNNKNNFPVELRGLLRLKIWRAVSTINSWFIDWFIVLFILKNHSDGAYCILGIVLKILWLIKPFHP